MKSVAKKLGAVIIALGLGVSGLTPFSPYTGVQAAWGDASANQIKHGTNRNELVSKDALDNTPAADYVIPEGTQAKAKEKKYNSYFLKEDLQTVSISIEENNLNWLLQNAKEKPTVMTKEVTIGDTTLGYTGLKTKGNYTLNATNDSTSDRFSFTVNFGKYIKKKNGYAATQNFYGCDKISFNNFFFDKTMMKEYNALRLMTELGVPTPQYGLAKLYINEQYYGVYLMVEAMDSSILQQYMNVSSKDVSSFLVKPSYYTPYYYSQDFENCKDSATGQITMETLLANGGLKQDDGGDYYAEAPLSNYAGLWEDDSDTLQDVAEMLPTALNWAEKLTNLSNGKDFEGKPLDVNSERYVTLLNQIMDVDEVTRYFAGHSFIIQMDYMFNTRQNYGLYLNEEGKAMLLPWDYDLGWGCYFEPITAEDVANWNIDVMYHSMGSEQHYANMSEEEIYSQFPIYHVIYQNKTLREKMHTYMNDCSKIAGVGGTTSDNEVYEAGRFSAKMTELYDKVVAAAGEKLASNVTYLNNYKQPTGAKNGIPNLNALIARRAVGVWLQTNGITGTKVTGYGCDSSTLGNAIDRTVTGTTTGNLTAVHEQTGIFASAVYAGNKNIGPLLSVSTMSEKDKDYAAIEKKVLADLVLAKNPGMTIYQMSNSKVPTSAYTVYLPVSSENVTIYSYRTDGTLTRLPATKYDHTYAVQTDDISCLIVASAKAPAPAEQTGQTTTVPTDDGKQKETVAGVKAGTVYKDKKAGVSYQVQKGAKTVQLTKVNAKKKTVVIPATIKIKGKSFKVTSIKANAFKNNKKLKKITIGMNIQKIGKNAFYGCKNLKQIVIKTKKLTSAKVGAKAFQKIAAKAKVKVPKSKKKSYTKWLKKKGITKKMKISKI